METIAYTADQVAEMLNLSTITIRRATTAGLMPCRRIGRAVRYTRSDIDAFLDKYEDSGYAC